MPKRYDRRRDMRRRMRDMRDRARRRRDRDYDMASRREYGDREHYRVRSSADYPQPDYARSRRTSEQRRQSDMHYGYPYTMKIWHDEPLYDYRKDYRGDYNYDYNYDYADGNDYLTEEELDEWAHELLRDVDPKDKQFFTEENIHEKAKLMNIQFDKFSPEELYVTTLMQYTDYKDVVGTSSPELFVAMAKAWLNDKDSELKQGEKLAVYYDEIICAED